MPLRLFGVRESDRVGGISPLQEVRPSFLRGIVGLAGMPQLRGLEAFVRAGAGGIFAVGIGAIIDTCLEVSRDDGGFEGLAVFAGKGSELFGFSSGCRLGARAFA